MLRRHGLLDLIDVLGGHRAPLRRVYGTRKLGAWALYGVAQAYKREGSMREAIAVEERFVRRWMGERGTIELADL